MEKIKLGLHAKLVKNNARKIVFQKLRDSLYNKLVINKGK